MKTGCGHAQGLSGSKSNGRVKGTGLRFIPVQHVGNQSSSPEEADAIRGIVVDILDSDSSWIDRERIERKIALDDILIIAPYNSQVFELQDRLPGARIGTVDKFQGQEAPIVIYSMTASSRADAPRGMGFLYSSKPIERGDLTGKIRLHLVGSPAVFEAECRSRRQMELLNAFCRYLEMATEI
jgi:uncharacterized protein